LRAVQGAVELEVEHTRGGWLHHTESGRKTREKKNARAELPVDHVCWLNARLVKNQHCAIHLAYWCGKPST
jgi:hypothetical protein